MQLVQHVRDDLRRAQVIPAPDDLREFLVSGVFEQVRTVVGLQQPHRAVPVEVAQRDRAVRFIARALRREQLQR